MLPFAASETPFNFVLEVPETLIGECNGVNVEER